MEQRLHGICKLVEETGELQQILGKIMAYPGGDHPDGKGPLKKRLEDELADTLAAIEYFSEVNLSVSSRFRIMKRKQVKIRRFSKWTLSGLMF